MRETNFDLHSGRRCPLTMVHTLVIGSGAAGLCAAVRLRAEGVDDVLVITEGLECGTSINTGSDKQTYYKLSLCGDTADAPAAMAQTYFDGGSMHGDLALVEASLSARAFLHLVNLGVPFPRDAYGQFVGYKTDHDPRERATSIGPYTSREMCRVLARRVSELDVTVREDRVVVALLVVDEGDHRRAAGAVAVDRRGQIEIIGAENVVFAVGGPGGLYRDSVYPQIHTGGIGLALAAGAEAANLAESQFGLASTAFRWNVSGTFMQVVPQLISTAADGVSDPREFLGQYFTQPERLHSLVFLKGYQWPFDARRVTDGSSIIDLLVYYETVVRGHRVFLDFRHNPAGFRFDALDAEAREYLRRSNATQATPIERLQAMNPGAINLYAEHGIDLSAEPLEVAVSAQHNNGGLATNHWWESTNIKHLFPIGEVNGSHGVCRPGGAALNAGQVGAFRAAEFIAQRYGHSTLDEDALRAAAGSAAADVLIWLQRSQQASSSWRDHRAELQARMSRDGAHVRSADALEQAVADSWRHYNRIEQSGGGRAESHEMAEPLRNRALGFAHAVYLEAIRFAVTSGVGSRGSAIALDADGQPIHDKLGPQWRIAPEQTAFREQVQQTQVLGSGQVENRWIPRRAIPDSDLWFETAWARFRAGEIYDT